MNTKILTYQQYNSKLSPVPPINWTYDSQTYNKLELNYPTAFDKSNQTWMLELIIIDRFLYGRLEVQLSKYYVLSICGKGESASIPLIEQAESNLDGLFRLHSYSEQLYEELACSKSQEEIELFWDYDKDLTYRNSSNHDISGSRVALYVPDDDFELIKEDYLAKRYSDTQRVYVLTGSIVSTQSTRTIKKYLQEFGAELISYYKKKGTLSGMVEYVELANELCNNKARTNLIKKNAPITLQWLEECRDNNEGVCEDLNQDIEKINMLYNHHKNTVEKLLDSPLVMYRLPKPGSPRIFDGLDQGLARDVRSRIYLGCFDLDLCRSQLVIIASLSGNAKLAKWAEMKDLWDEVRLDTGVPKLISKSCVYTYCFGGNANTWVNEGYIEREYIDDLRDHELFIALREAGKVLRDKVEAEGFIEIDNYKLYLSEDITPRQAVAIKVQYIESMIIKSVVEYIKTEQQNINLIGIYHDGVLLKFKSQGKSPRKYINTINEIASKRGLELGINNIKMDYK